MNETQMIEFLWNLLDDIDTAGDIAKSDDKLFRGLAEKAQSKRWDIGITSDGYDIDLSMLEIKSSEHFETWWQEEACDMLSSLSVKQVLAIVWSNGEFTQGRKDEHKRL